MRRLLVVPTVILAATLGLAGCSASGGAQSSIAENQGARSDVSAGGGTTDSAGAKAAPTAAIVRQVVITGSMSLRVKNPSSVGDAVVQLVEGAGGRIDGRTQIAATKTHEGTAQLRLRIPADALNDTLDSIKRLGHVTSLHTSVADVTTKSQDLDARITALQTSVVRLEALEAKAKRVDDLIELESDISDRQGQLDSLSAQRRYLSDQIAMSTITLNLTAPQLAAAKAKGPTPGDAFSAGFGSFGAFFSALFLALTFLFPWLILGAIIAVIWVALVRRHRRRRAARGEPPVAGPATVPSA